MESVWARSSFGMPDLQVDRSWSNVTPTRPKWQSTPTWVAQGTSSVFLTSIYMGFTVPRWKHRTRLLRACLVWHNSMGSSRLLTNSHTSGKLSNIIKWIVFTLDRYLDCITRVTAQVTSLKSDAQCLSATEPMSILQPSVGRRILHILIRGENGMRKPGHNDFSFG